ncbi:MAG TPA: hypothetical protein VLI39_05660 [Sedimentisphaerales bacterium]|nr:hypothetical protein [Sedimentisphaerales bacterium]
MQDLKKDGVRAKGAEGKASFQMVLPMSPLLSEVAGAIEQTATQAGLLMMKALIDEEVEQIAGTRYGHQADRQAIFSSTNIIESCFSRAGDLSHNVKRWRDGNMARRWAASVLLEAQSRFRRIQAYSQLPQLINAIATLLDKKEAAA